MTSQRMSTIEVFSDLNTALHLALLGLAALKIPNKKCITRKRTVFNSTLSILNFVSIKYLECVMRETCQCVISASKRLVVIDTRNDPDTALEVSGIWSPRRFRNSKEQAGSQKSINFFISLLHFFSVIFYSFLPISKCVR